MKTGTTRMPASFPMGYDHQIIPKEMTGGGGKGGREIEKQILAEPSLEEKQYFH